MHALLLAASVLSLNAHAFTEDQLQIGKRETVTLEVGDKREHTDKFVVMPQGHPLSAEAMMDWPQTYRAFVTCVSEPASHTALRAKSQEKNWSDEKVQKKLRNATRVAHQPDRSVQVELVAGESVALGDRYYVCTKPAYAQPIRVPEMSDLEQP